MNHYFTKNNNIKSNEKTIEFTFNNKQYKFLTDNGVFSKDGLDIGTEVLLKALNFENIKGDVLDLGCGYGPIGIILSKNTTAKIDMIDINDRAISLTKKNITLNKATNIDVFESDGYENVKKKYDYIITNPPIRVGKEILYKILKEAKEHLKPDGELWFVINKHQGAKSTAKDMASVYNIEVVEKSKNFFVIKAKNNWQFELCLITL